MKRTLLILCILGCLLLPAGQVLAAPVTDRVVGPDDESPVDITLWDDDLDVEEGATVRGDVTVFNGDVTIAGRINGDLVVFNGDLELAETAVLRGDCVVFNGTVEDDSSAGISCFNPEDLPAIPGLDNWITDTEGIPGGEVVVETPYRPNFFLQFLGMIGRTLLVGGLAFLAATALPQHMQHAQQAVREKPLITAGVGVLTTLAVPAIVVLLIPVSIVLLFVCVGILGFPLMVALLMALGVGALFGWIIIGSIVGDWLAGRSGRSWTTAQKTALGTMLLTVGFGVLSLIPYVVLEGFASYLVMSLGLGAVVLTKFGTRGYPVSGQTAPEPNPEKVTAVIDTLPVEDVDSFKESED